MLYLSDMGIDYIKMFETIKIPLMDYPIKFYLVPDNFQIPDEGILENDFLDRYFAIINFDTKQVEYNGMKYNSILGIRSLSQRDQLKHFTSK